MRTLANGKGRSPVENSRPHVSSSSPSNNDHFLRFLPQQPNGSITREIHTRPIPAGTIQRDAQQNNELAYFLAIFDNGNVV